MAGRERVKTGIKGLDAILGGGIPRGNVILLEGAIGTGKTTFGVEFVYRGAREFGEPGLVVLFEMSPERLVSDTAELGWDLPALERAGTLKLISTTRQVFVEELRQPDSVLLEMAARMGAKRIFIDGVPSMAGVADTAVQARDAFQLLAEGLQLNQRTAILAVEATAFSEARTVALPEEAIADTVIRLRLEDVTRAAVRSIEIVKSRGHQFQMGRHSLGIVDGAGMVVYRRVQAPRSPMRDQAAAFDATTRVTTGVPGLDTLVNGGYLLGSTTVVAGISGVGKSVMGLQFLAEGARRGEPGLMLSLDEQVPQILRNAASIGIDLQQWIDSGVVKVQYDTPQEIEIDRHFHDIEDLVDTFKPTRVLFDSLSTYGSNLGTEGRVFRDFFHALVALMKQNQTATVYNHENPEMLGMGTMMGEFHMSSLVDNIILMNWIELGRAFRLGLTVAKMRANPNTRATYECEILNGRGMRVLPNQISSDVARPFSGYLNLIARTPARQWVDTPVPARASDGGHVQPDEPQR